MKKNPLSVWTFSYRKSYYLTHPWKWFKDIYWNIRNFWHRGRYGYAYTDVWNFCDWYPRVGAEALRYLAENHSSYPGIKPWQTSKLWGDHLEHLAKQLKRCADSQDITWGEDRNEYKDEFNAIMEKTRLIKEDEDGNTILSHKDFTPEEEEIRKNYFRRSEEIAQADKQYREEVYRFLGANIERYWD